MIIQTLTLNKENITDFAIERNNLLKISTSEWVLFMDKDEKAHNLKLNIDTRFSSFRILRKNYFLGQYVGSEKIIRLVKKGSGKWVRRVHEVWSTNENVGEIKDGYIIHNTADKLAEYLKKINYYSTLHAEANHDEGKKSSLGKIIVYPPLKFAVTLIKSKNIVFSIMQSLHSFLAWSKLFFSYS